MICCFCFLAFIKPLLRSPVREMSRGRGKEGHRSRARFDVNRNFFSLTYPKCPLTCDEFVQFFDKYTEKVGIWDWLAVVQENHEDGTKHLHALVYYISKHRVRNCRYWDLFVQCEQCNGGHGRCAECTVYHGNYMATRNAEAWYSYMCKEGEPVRKWGSHHVSAGDSLPFDRGTRVRSYEERREDPSTRAGGGRGGGGMKMYEVMQELIAGKHLCDVMMNPRFTAICVQYGRSLEALVTRREARKASLTKYFVKASYKNVGDFQLDDCNNRIVEWLNANFTKGAVRELRSPALYVVGPPKCGKTHLSEQLKKCVNWFKPNRHEDFYDMYSDKDHEAWFFDEFAGQKTIQFMNELIDGVEMTLRVKGGQRMKTKNVPVFIFTNKYLDELYKEAQGMRSTEYEAFVSRLIVVALPAVRQGINIEIEMGDRELNTSE